MDSSHNADNITYHSIHWTSKRYEEVVPSKISGLDGLRLRDIPEVLNQRKIDGEVFLEKTEVVSLVEWKLYAFSYRFRIGAITNTMEIVASMVLIDQTSQNWSPKTVLKKFEKRRRKLSPSMRRTTPTTPRPSPP